MENQNPAPESVPSTPAPVAAAPVAQSVAPVAAKGGSNTVLIVVILLLVVGLVVGGILVVGELNKRNAANTTNSALDQASNILKNLGLPTPTDSKSNDTGSSSSSTDDSTTSSDESDYNWTADVPSDFPSDFPIYPGAQSAGGATSSEGSGAILLTDATQAQIVSYYKTEMAKKGWKLDSEQSLFGYSLSFLKDTREATVIIIADPEGVEPTTLMLNVAPASSN